MTTTTVIADDEHLARQKLRTMLTDVPWITCVGEAADGPATVEIVNQLAPDLLFLDIRMPGLTGLEVLQRLTARPHIVFTTAYDEYAVTAFEIRALDYLLKPFGRRRLQNTLERVREVLGTGSHAVAGGLDALGGNGPLRRLFVRTRGGIVPVGMEDVIRFEARDDYVGVHTPSGRLLASIRMGELERQLDPESFVRLHRSHIVNLAFVASMVPQTSGRLLVTMMDGTRLLASRGRSRTLRRRAV